MSWKNLARRALRLGLQEGRKYLDNRDRGGDRSRPGRSRPQASSPHGSVPPGPVPTGPAPVRREESTASAGGGDYPGDYTGPLRLQYAPHPDGDADPGEIVWGWIPYEEDHTQGKDRPSLVIGRDGSYALVLMLSSKDHIPGGLGEVAHRNGARWMNIGAGPWDKQGRDSEIRLDRVIRLADSAMRREGAVVDRETFEMIVAEVHAG